MSTRTVTCYIFTMNDRLEFAMLGDIPDPLHWGWLGSEFSAFSQGMEAQAEPSEHALKLEAQPPSSELPETQTAG